MSDSITIKEGGASRAFGPVSRLRVAKQGTGTEDFVPESATSETTKNITENGTYFAMQDNAYGYSQVTVNCSHEADSLTGKKSDGNEYTVSKDGSGNIQEDKVPSALLIVLAPLKNAYNDGETIDLTGIVAVAVDGNDQPWTGGGRYPDGIIPASELILPVNTAHYDESQGGEEVVSGVPESFTEMLNVVDVPFPIHGVPYHAAVISLNEPLYFTYSVNGPARVCSLKRGTNYFHLSATRNDGLHMGATMSRDGYPEPGDFEWAMTNTFSHDDKTVVYGHYNSYDPYEIDFPYAESKLNIEYLTSRQLDQIAWTIIYGNIIHLPTQQDVAVQWRRPGDGKILSDEFAILVSKTA